MKGPWSKEDNFLIYCPPVKWVSHCWRHIAHDADPRFHPSAWRRAQRLIHLNRTRCKHIGCYPSTGIMAVLYAIDACESVTVYGFGANEPGAHVQCDDGQREQQRDACATGRVCDKYYRRSGEPFRFLARAQQCERTRRHAAAGRSEQLGFGKTTYGKADYFQEAAIAHDLVQEWGWLARLHQSGAIRWRGRPAQGADSDGSKTHQMEP